MTSVHCTASLCYNDFVSIRHGVMHTNRSPDGLLRKGVLKICRKFTGENPCGSVILIKLLWNFKFATYFQNTFS